MNGLEGIPLSYLIGADNGIKGIQGRLFVVPYDHEPTRFGMSAGYCNLFDELNTGKFGPYLHNSDTAEEYNEGQIDPKGKGWLKNLGEQFSRRQREGFQYIELDNPDAYDVKDVIGAINIAEHYNLKVFAKNPLLWDSGADSITYLSHPNICGAIIEQSECTPLDMDRLRKQVDKPKLPVWFVSFGAGKLWAKNTASYIKDYHFLNMGVTYSVKGEYKTSQDILLPITA